MRYGYLVAMGLILMAIGGILLGVSGVKVKTMTQSYYIYIPRYGTDPPGLLLHEHYKYNNGVYRESGWY